MGFIYLFYLLTYMEICETKVLHFNGTLECHESYLCIYLSERKDTLVPAAGSHVSGCSPIYLCICIFF